MSASVTVTAASPAVVTYALHPYATGQKLRFDFTTGGSMPSGMTQGTDYFARWASTNTFQLSSTNASSQVTITIASPGVVTWAGHGFTGNEALFLGTNGALPTGLTASNNNLAVPTYYYVKYIDANTFNLSTTPGGANINTSGSQSGTHFATKHVPVNTTTTGSNVVVMGYDPGVYESSQWATSTAYLVGQRVTNSGSTYTCLVAHTSGTFSTDLSNGKWLLTKDVILGSGMVTVLSVKLVTSITLTGLKTGSDIVILQAGTSNEYLNIDQNPTTSYQYNTLKSGNIDIGVFKQGYVPFYIRNYTIPDTPMTLPVVQVSDRNYA